MVFPAVVFVDGYSARSPYNNLGAQQQRFFGDNWPLWNSVHTPVLILEGNLDEYKAYENGLGDFNGISLTGNPVMFFSHREMHHGGDLWNANGGHFTKITLAWLNWWMKGDTGATGKQFLTTNCSYCNDSKWEFKSANIP